MSMRERRLTDWLLERYRLGELPAPQLDAVRCALADDAHARARLEALDASELRIPASAVEVGVSPSVEPVGPQA